MAAPGRRLRNCDGIPLSRRLQFETNLFVNTAFQVDVVDQSIWLLGRFNILYSFNAGSLRTRHRSTRTYLCAFRTGTGPILSITRTSDNNYVVCTDTGLSLWSSDGEMVRRITRNAAIKYHGAIVQGDTILALGERDGVLLCHRVTNLIDDQNYETLLNRCKKTNDVYTFGLVNSGYVICAAYTAELYHIPFLGQGDFMNVYPVPCLSKIAFSDGTRVLIIVFEDHGGIIVYNDEFATIERPSFIQIPLQPPNSGMFEPIIRPVAGTVSSDGEIVLIDKNQDNLSARISFYEFPAQQPQPEFESRPELEPEP